jgi:hypothetical protein
MLPRMEIDDSHVVELLKLKVDTPDSDQTFLNMV